MKKKAGATERVQRLSMKKNTFEEKKEETPEVSTPAKTKRSVVGKELTETFMKVPNTMPLSSRPSSNMSQSPERLKKEETELSLNYLGIEHQSSKKMKKPA